MPCGLTGIWRRCSSNSHALGGAARRRELAALSRGKHGASSSCPHRPRRAATPLSPLVRIPAPPGAARLPQAAGSAPCSALLGRDPTSHTGSSGRGLREPARGPPAHAAGEARAVSRWRIMGEPTLHAVRNRSGRLRNRTLSQQIECRSSSSGIQSVRSFRPSTGPPSLRGRRREAASGQRLSCARSTTRVPSDNTEACGVRQTIDACTCGAFPRVLKI